MKKPEMKPSATRKKKKSTLKKKDLKKPKKVVKTCKTKKKSTIKKKPKKKTRIDKEMNRTLVTIAFKKLLLKTGHRPTVKMLVDETGLSTTTISSHINSFDFRDEVKAWRAMTPDVIKAIYESAVMGKVGAQKLWAQIVGEWREGMEVEHSAKNSLAEMIAETNGIALRKNGKSNT